MTDFVPKVFKVDENVIDEILSRVEEGRAPSWHIFMAIDYVYHHKDIDYNGGLSFLDRIYKKLKPASWNLNDLKFRIYKKETTLVDVVQEVFSDPNNAAVYGV